MEGRSSVGIRDVALEADVSITTVSHALNGKGRIPETTRRRVQEAADRLGYRPNAMARILAGGRSQVIAIAFSFAEAPPSYAMTAVDYFNKAMHGATERALERDYAAVVAPPSLRSSLWSRVPFDGALVFDPVEGDPVLEMLRRAGTPIVTAGRDPSGPGDDYCVVNDHFKGTRSVLDHLRERGARRIALLAYPLGDSFTDNTIRAHTEWCADRGYEPLVELVRPLTGETAPEMIRALLTRSDRPDGIYAAEEDLGITTVHVAEGCGLRVPADLRVVAGTDRETFPGIALTSLNFNPGRIASEAVDLLIDVVEGHPPAERAREVPTRLVPRASTAAPEWHHSTPTG